MHKKTKEIYNEDIFSTICSRFALNKQHVTILDGFENFIYEFKKGSRDYILRVTHSLHRNLAEIKAEINWVNYLAGNNVSVSRAVNSPAGNLVEKVDLEGTYFMATAFEKASGRHVNREDINAELFQNLGNMLGRMHKLTCDYRPYDPDCLRPDWDVEISDLKQFIPANEISIGSRFDEIMKLMRALPAEKNAFGLIHTDAHFGNMFIDNGKLTLFDFDDSAYKWFISDIAIVLFYGVMWTPEKKNRQEYGEFIFNSFMKGYRQEYSLDPYWFELMPEFLKLREIVLYAAIHMGFDVPNLKDKWCLNYLNGRKEKIELDRPYLDLNFKKLALN